MRSIVLVSLALATSAFAAKKPKLPLVWVDGPPNVGRLFSKTLAKSASMRPLTSTLGDAPTAREIVEVCQASDASAVIHVRQRGASYAVMVLNCADGSPLDTLSMRVAAKAVPADLTKALAAAIKQSRPAKRGAKPKVVEPAPEPAAPEESDPDMPALSGPSRAPASPPPPPAPEPARRAEPAVTREREPASEAAASSSEPANPNAIAFQLSFGLRGFGRRLTWGNQVGTDPITYSNPFMIAPSVDLAWYPAAKLSTHFLANLGVIALLDSSLGSPTRERTTNEGFTTTATRWRLAASLRVPVGKVLEVGGNFGVQSSAFAIAQVSSRLGLQKHALPSVLYFAPRLGARVALRLGEVVTLEAFGGLHFVTSQGEVATAAYFPRARTFGIDAGGALRLRFSEGLSLFGAFEWQRFMLTLNPEDGAVLYARTAVDQSFAGTIGVGFAL